MKSALLRAADNGALVLRGDVIALLPNDHGYGWKESAAAYSAKFGSLDGFESDFAVVVDLPDDLGVDFFETLPDGRRRYAVNLDAAAMEGLQVIGNVYASPPGYGPPEIAALTIERT